MSFAPEYVAGTTTHARRGAIQNRFSYNVDFVLIDPEANETGPRLFSRNARNLAAVHDIDHGGLLGQGRGAAWARGVFASHGIIAPSLRLLTQPRFAGFTFNPVSFWLAMKDGALVGVISEVSTPFGDRHSYISHLPDFGQRMIVFTNRDLLGMPDSPEMKPLRIGLLFDHDSYICVP